jgi:beta-lactamase class A
MAAAPKKHQHPLKMNTVPTVQWLHTHYGRYMPVRKHHRVLIWVVFVFLAVIIAFQLAYPYGRGLLFANVGTTAVRFKSHDELAEIITKQFDASKLKITVGKDKSVEFPLKSAGAEPNTEGMIARLSEYPTWQRLIPGSILWQVRGLDELSVFYTNKPFREYISEKSKELSFPPQNAHLAIEKGKLVASEAIAGSQVNGDELLQTISGAKITPGAITVIEAPARRTKADRSSADLSKVRMQAEAALAHEVTLSGGGQDFKPDKNEVASWIVLATDAKGDVALSVDKEKIKAYLNELNKKIGTPAGQTDMTIIDGREVGRVTGSLGKAIDSATVADQIAAALTKAPSVIALGLPMVDVQPGIIYNSKYTATQAGLQAYLNDTARTKNMHIKIEQLDGERWTAAARENESIPSGSTYKLFVALVLFDKMERGEIHWGDPMLDTTVAGCFERMTVASTNPCAEKWIADFGRQYINDFIHARGFSQGTSFTTGSANQTTATDLNKYMKGLNDGTLVAGGYRDRLLDSLGRHPYRYGIPTGSQGTVHDKVGFLWDYVHDTAIVQHPRGTYIMTIMTKGQSYAAIASVTREIERIMYP